MAHSLAPVQRNSERDLWLIAWAVTVALHLVAFLIFRTLPAPKPPPTTHRLEPIRLVFAKPATATAARKPDQPHVFTELPPNRADVAPKQAEFLSNVTSRARDNVPGGDRDLPRMQGEGDAPGVKLEPSRGSPLALPMPELRSSAPPPKPATNAAQSHATPVKDQAGSAASASPQSSTTPTPQATDVTPHDAAAGSSGNYDIFQPEMANPEGNAALTGDVSLNTMAWNYAPWLERFERELMHRWIPPPAYSMGILKEGGWALIEVEISRSGEMLRLQLLEAQGHPSLSQAAQGALRSMAPIERLPADFPEPTLILRIRMIYPRLRSR